jgi:hypothetical protein
MEDFLKSVINNSKDPEIWSGEEHANFILRLSEAILEILKAQEFQGKYNLNQDTTEKIEIIFKKSLNQISKLLATAPYSSLENTKLISKKNLDEITNKLSHAKMYSDRLTDISNKLENESQKLKEKINYVDELLHWNNC